MDRRPILGFLSPGILEFRISRAFSPLLFVAIFDFLYL